jgi:hypothetical protein
MSGKQLILDSLIGGLVSAGMRINWVSGGTKDKNVKTVLEGITSLIESGKLKVIGTYSDAADMEAVPVDLVKLMKSINAKDESYVIPACEDNQYHVFYGTIFPRWVNEGPAEDSLAGMFATAGGDAQKAGGLY